MTATKVLFIGGTGIISSAASALAAERGMEVTLLNRGRSARPPADGVEVLTADIADAAAVDAVLAGREFDVVADMIAFTSDQVRRDLDRFDGRTGQYVFISSASAYQKPVARLPITESTPLRNPYWQYSRDKIACEELLATAYRDRNFPVTVLRPSHTYDKWTIPAFGGWTAIDRIRRGEEIVVHGDGTSLWTLTHASDFAVGFVGLLGNPLAYGDTFQITSDFVYTWNEIYSILGLAAGAEPKLRYATSAAFERAAPDRAGQLTGDMAHSVVFDNTKIRRLVPDYNPTAALHLAAQEIIEWHDAHPELQRVDLEMNTLFDELIRSDSA
ncbi:MULTISPECIES: NAD-dependent epimerase/dehydratase family protein [unclassified Microbacterium]|uniref:NAD-dependent epimerase/dehydratase family protein n=1 Tax=unclassified Microbacterium TaxID=2609290 RepID=UPI000EAA9E3E|nr:MULTISPECIES: NAD-dependent epimerase/dehydratase family protein [unclassified Microbacterium]MBT2486889.1 NAD-dependent epimerase/dehydratase family protein [Microbacterium sp. ISL-108]RKN64806.1 NAD-dependent epimerase/dehydratase family protein [Microbacterium sp. CGR2]